MWIMNLGKPVNIPVLNEAMAIELGANLLGEGIIFIIAAGILISEYNRWFIRAKREFFCGGFKMVLWAGLPGKRRLRRPRKRRRCSDCRIR